MMRFRLASMGLMLCGVVLLLTVTSHGQGARGAQAAVQKLITDPGGVEVLVDGMARGTTDVETGVLVVRDLPFGEHSFTLRRRGFEAVRFEVRYEYERMGEIFVSMKALEAEQPAGTLLLEDVMEMIESDVALEHIAALVRKKGVALDLAEESAWRHLGTAAKAVERRKRLTALLVAGSAQDVLRGKYVSAIRALEFAVRLDTSNATAREVLGRTRRARETELEVLSRR